MHITISPQDYNKILEQLQELPNRYDIKQYYYPTPSQCDYLEQHIETYYEFILYLLVTQTNPITKDEISSMNRLKRIIYNHTIFQ